LHFCRAISIFNYNTKINNQTIFVANPKNLTKLDRMSRLPKEHPRLQGNSKIAITIFVLLLIFAILEKVYTWLKEML